METVEQEARGDRINAPVEGVSTTSKVLLYHCRARLQATPLGVWAGVKAPELCGTRGRLNVPCRCLPAILSVQYHTLLWQLGVQPRGLAEYSEARVVWVILVLPQHRERIGRGRDVNASAEAGTWACGSGPMRGPAPCITIIMD